MASNRYNVPAFDARHGGRGGSALAALDRAVVDRLTLSCTMVPGQTHPRQVLNLEAIKKYSDQHAN